jgi:Asp-tRNA(Asn)/Glu-tRNA(Gln) amidotransferase A subunit family amidase
MIEIIIKSDPNPTVPAGERKAGLPIGLQIS